MSYTAGNPSDDKPKPRKPPSQKNQRKPSLLMEKLRSAMKTPPPPPVETPPPEIEKAKELQKPQGKYQIDLSKSRIMSENIHKYLMKTLVHYVSSLVRVIHSCLKKKQDFMMYTSGN